MTQPKFAPILVQDEVRDVSKLAAPVPWSVHRPADFAPEPGAPRRLGRGSAGPDQGYAMLLAERFGDKVRLEEGERLADVLRGASVIATRRASLYGRAPVMADVELPLRLFGYLGRLPRGAGEVRRELFGGVAHDYWRERQLADIVPESTLRLTPPGLSDLLDDDPAMFAALSGTVVLAKTLAPTGASAGEGNAAGR